MGCLGLGRVPLAALQNQGHPALQMYMSPSYLGSTAPGLMIALLSATTHPPTG
jgi:hypothetical protein